MYSDLFVNRCGSIVDSCMKTIRVINKIKPNEIYNIKSHNIEKTFNPSTIKSNCIMIPPYIKFPNNWNTYVIHNNINNNILGKSGEFKIDGNLMIPLAETIQEHLSFYNCLLVKHDDNIQFDTPKDIPLFEMEIGKNYVSDYLLTNRGGGAYLEYHDTPHFHMPLNDQCDGYLILGKIINDHCYLSAFKIPYLYAIYTRPFTIHCDAYLVGKYLVAYAKTENFPTVLLKNNNDTANVIIK